MLYFFHIKKSCRFVSRKVERLVESGRPVKDRENTKLKKKGGNQKRQKKKKTRKKYVKN